MARGCNKAQRPPIWRNVVSEGQRKGRVSEGVEKDRSKSERIWALELARFRAAPDGRAALLQGYDDFGEVIMIPEITVMYMDNISSGQAR